jgi:hypothetical protein
MLPWQIEICDKVRTTLYRKVGARDPVGAATIGRIHEALRKGLTKDAYDSVYSHDSPFFNTPTLTIRTLVQRGRPWL